MKLFYVSSYFSARKPLSVDNKPNKDVLKRKEAEPKNSSHKLPEECIRHICSFLNAAELISLSCVNSYLHNLCQVNAVWICFLDDAIKASYLPYRQKEARLAFSEPRNRKSRYLLDDKAGIEFLQAKNPSIKLEGILLLYFQTGQLSVDIFETLSNADVKKLTRFGMQKYVLQGLLSPTDILMTPSYDLSKFDNPNIQKYLDNGILKKDQILKMPLYDVPKFSHVEIQKLLDSGVFTSEHVLAMDTFQIYRLKWTIHASL